MNEHQPDALEQALKAATWWREPAPKLWKRALSQAKNPAQKKRRLHRIMSSRWPWIGAPIAAVIIAAVVLRPAVRDGGTISAGNMRGAGSYTYTESPDQSPKSFISPSSEAAETEDNPQVHWDFDRWNDAYNLSLGDASRGYFKLNPDGSRTPVKNWLSASTRGFARPSLDSDGDGSPDAGRSIAWSVVGADSVGGFSYRSAQISQSQPSGTARDFAGEPSSVSRHIIHRASIDLRTDDVRGAYIKLQTLIPSPGEGEYVEAAQIHTNNNVVTAYVTLRIQPTRLSQVLSALRNLAEVTSEQTDASDVSTQVVDLEARLRNEKRLEQELLELLDKRQDAPLEDILKVNDSLAQVRGRIEQLTAQQQTLARQVALAAVVVTIRQKDAPPPTPPSFTSGFAKKISSAWTAGLDFLAASLAAILQTIVGGLLFWIALIVILVLVRRWYLRRSA